jgi:CDP-glucose 4,6-dehydratase
VVSPLAAPLPDPAFWHGRRVLVTGHTGFKGAWLTLWLRELGAHVHGFALGPPTQPSLYELAGLAAAIARDTRGDLRDAAAVGDCLATAQPEIVFHLAAQSLVRASYAEPATTFATNVQGTVHLLDAIRRCNAVRAAVIVTSDKCYQNHGQGLPYRESDPLGGHDPYSASKACAEIATASWRASFATGGDAPRMASARAGNVIGAGDWAAERLLPDCIRAFSRGEPVHLRHPAAVRPWQHVLEPLTGYLLLAERLCAADGISCARAWNFGPDPESETEVGRVATEAARLWGEGARVERAPNPAAPREAQMLRLDSGAARARIGWRPRWSLAQALQATISGYRTHAAGGDLAACVRRQIAEYCDTPAPTVS